MKKIIVALFIIPIMLCIRWHVGTTADGQTLSIGIVTKPDASNLLDSMNAPKDRNAGALLFTLKFWGTNEQRLYIWQNGTPTSDSTQSYINKGYIIRPMVVRAVGDTAWCSGYWTAATLYTDAALVRNLAYRVGLAGFAKYADVLTERSRALAAEDALSNRIAAIPAGATGATGATGAQGIQGVPGSPATPNTASTPLSIAGSNISIQTANGGQSGALSAADWTTFNGKLSSFTETDPTVSSTVKSITSGNIASWNDKSYASLTGKPALFSGAYIDLTNKPILFDGQYSSLTGKPTLFDGNYNSLSNLPTLFNGTWSSLTGKPTTLAGYGITDGVSTSVLSGYQPLLTTGSTLQYRRGDNSLATLNSSVVPELTNLYWTQARFDAALTAKSTTDIVEGINLYWTPSRFNGSFASKSTTDLPEGANQYFTQVRARSSVSGLSNGGITYNPTTGEISQVIPTNSAAPARTLNASFTVSATRPARLYYSIRIAYSITVVLGSTGTATLQYSTDGGTSWISFPPVSNSLNLGIALTGYNDFQLGGEVPAGALERIVTTATNATITLNSSLSREVVF